MMVIGEHRGGHRRTQDQNDGRRGRTYSLELQNKEATADAEAS